MSAYADYCAQRLATWKERNPVPAERLRTAIVIELGMRGHTSSQIAQDTLARWETLVLRALLSWPSESEFNASQPETPAA